MLQNIFFIVLFVIASGISPELTKVAEESARYRFDTLQLPPQYAFLNSRTEISDSALTLSSFFDSLLSKRVQQLPIVHYGDSHVQAGFMTEVIMYSLGENYGYGGRGFLAPHRLSGRNEPRDYTIESVGEPSSSATIAHWKTKEQHKGISGVSVQYEDSTSLSVELYDVMDIAHRAKFSHVTLFGDSIKRHTLDSAALATQFVVPPGNFHGISLENGHPGVIYHAIGVNGATFMHFGRHPEPARSSQALNPQLLIVSLGSNEAYARRFNGEQFLEQVDSFLAPLREANPSVPILITSPAEALSRKKPNPNFETIAALLQDYCQRNDFAYYDLFEAAGAKGASLAWNENEMMGRDGIHFKKEGYHLQGILIFNALQRAAKKHHGRNIQ